MQSSVSIEGFTVAPDEAAAIVAGDEVPAPEDTDRMAVACYAQAMDHVGTMAIDPHFTWMDRVILDRHFDACYFQRDRAPGLWRTTPVHVTSQVGGAPALGVHNGTPLQTEWPVGRGPHRFHGPPPEDVPALMAEVVDWLEHGDLDAHVVVRAAMAHLHVVSIHPFADGNGRISRIVQSLVLAREGLLAPELTSIEEYLGAHTRDYDGVLQQVQGGQYQPSRDASAWVAFCVEAHTDQARRRLAQVTQAGVRWAALEELARQRAWPDRLVIALEQAMFDGAGRAAYAADADVSPATATADLRRLVDAGLLVQRGRARRTQYVASAELRQHVAQALAR